MLTNNDRSLFGLLQTFWKWRFWLVVFALVGLAGGILAIRASTPRFVASTLILVEAQKVPRDYVKTTVTSSLAERLRTIQQQITNRENLERIIEEFGLYPELRGAAMPMEGLVGRAQQNLSVRVEQGATFRISFRGTDRNAVAEVANRIAELFILENLKQRESQAERTSQFLEAELADLKQELEQKEAKVANFRLLHEGELPGQRESNLAAISQLEARLDVNREATENAKVKRFLIERELRSDEPAPQVAQPTTEESRLTELRLQLVELSSRYTDRHPDVIRLKREIAELEKATVAPAGEQPIALPDPALQAELDAVDRELARLEAERGRILAQIAHYQGRLERTPQVGQQLLVLTRDYENLHKSYQSLLSKRLEARLAENLERSQQSEQFRVLERAVPPVRPYAPNRKFYLAAGLGLGLLLGIGLVLAREETTQTFGDARSLQRAYPGVALLAEIPLIEVSKKRGFKMPWPGRKIA